MTKTYIGDSVYFDFDGYSIILTTENGGGPSNTIVIEPQVWKNLVEAVEQAKKQREEGE